MDIIRGDSHKCDTGSNIRDAAVEAQAATARAPPQAATARAPPQAADTLGPAAVPPLAPTQWHSASQ